MATGFVPPGQSSRDIIRMAQRRYAFLDPIKVLRPLKQSLRHCYVVRVFPRSYTAPRRTDTVLLRLVASDTNDDAAEHQVPAIINQVKALFHPALCTIIDTAVTRRPWRGVRGNILPGGEGQGVGHFYTVPGYHGTNGSLNDINNLGWTGDVPEAFIWHVFLELVEGIAFLHQKDIALCAQDLLTRTHAILKPIPGISDIASTSAYCQILIEDYSRVTSRASFVPCTLRDNGLTWHLQTFEDAKARDVMALGQLIHHLMHQRDLSSRRSCQCPASVDDKYSDELTYWQIGAATGNLTIDETVQGIQAIAAAWRAGMPDLQLSSELVLRFKELAEEFDDLVVPAVDRANR